jgi:dihydroceramidase
MASQITASVDWCEQNYAKTQHIAEFWNTLSSVPLSLVALIGLWFGIKNQYPLRIMVAYVGLFIVGIGSMAFHGTLTREGQALDELSMLCTVTCLFYCILDENDFKRFPPRFLVPLLIIFNIALSVVYSWFPWYFNFFIVVYVGIVIMLSRRAYHIAFGSVPASSSEVDRAGAVLNRIATPTQRKWLKMLVGLALGNYIGGSLFFWVPEMFIICIPNGYIQLHALFHLTSAVGAYSFIVFATVYHYLVFVNGRLPPVSNPVSIRVDSLVFPLYVCHVKSAATLK